MGGPSLPTPIPPHSEGPILITTSLRDRLDALGRRARFHDLYSPEGSVVYDTLVGTDRGEIREVLALGRARGGRVLDLAAGSGRLSLPLRRLDLEVTALDISAAMLAPLRLRAATDPRLRVVQADMVTARLGESFDLIVLGATSICLLDADQRRRLYANVRAHLNDDGVFALSVATESAAAGMRTTQDRWLDVSGTRRYLLSQEWSPTERKRVINVVADELAPGEDGRVPVYGSTLHVLDESTIRAELEGSGARLAAPRPLRSPAADAASPIVFVEATWPG